MDGTRGSGRQGGGGLWTAEDVATFLGVSPKTVRKWQLAGTLPFVKLGGKLVRFQPEVVRDWVGGQVVGRPVAEPALVVDLRRRLSR